MITLALTDTVYVESMQGVDNVNGEPFYGDKTPKKARVEQKVEEVINQDGQQRTSSYVVYFQEKLDKNSIVYVEENGEGYRHITVEFSKGILNPITLCKVVL